MAPDIYRIKPDLRRDSSGQVVDYLDSPPGSGKTRLLIHALAKRIFADGRKVMVLQPTKQLLDSTFDTEVVAAGLPDVCRVFHGGLVAEDASVGREMVEFLRSDASAFVSLLLVTTPTLPFIRHCPNQSDWHLVFDEVPDVLSDFRDFVPAKYGRLLLKHVAVDPASRGPEFARLTVEGRATMLKAINRGFALRNSENLEPVWGDAAEGREPAL